MHAKLLPASAAAFAPRASVNVVLGAKAEPWLTQTLKRVNRVKRPLNNVQQHQRCLADILSSSTAYWTLASLLLAKTPDAQLDANSLESPCLAMNNYYFLHVEAYVVHVDMVLRDEVAFKLTVESIRALVQYHKDVFCPNAVASSIDWPDKDDQCKNLHHDFVQAINKYVYRAPVLSLDGLEEDGSGELLCGKSEEVKNQVLALMKPLLPPPPPPAPRIIDLVRPPTLLPSSLTSLPANIWSQSLPLQAPVEAWRILPSSSPAIVSSPLPPPPEMALWASVGFDDLQMPSHLDAVSLASPIGGPAVTLPYTMADLYYGSPLMSSAPIMALPSTQLPGMLSPPCGMTSSMAYNAFGSFGWDRLHDYTTTI